MTESLNTPPGAAEVYSDLSFITLQMVVGTIALDQHLVSPDSFLPQCQAAVLGLAGRGSKNTTTPSSFTDNKHDPISIVCAFEAFVRQEVFHRPSPSPSPIGGGTGTGTGTGSEPWLASTSYLPPAEMYPLCAPTMDDTGMMRERGGGV